ncbi:MAG: RnfABCDGE type electron transport complex subunit D [bacterium]|nr:RnfABCDGE type electron transport complex subunit D [bacterium]
MTPPQVDLAEPLRGGRPPHLHGGLSHRHFTRAFLIACIPPVAAGLVLYGQAAAGVLFWAALGAIAGEALAHHTAPPTARRSLAQSLLIGMLLGLTLPPTVPWYVPLLGGLTGVWICVGILGGSGNCLWHPALIGRAILQLLFGGQLAPRDWPVLISERVWSGSIHASLDAVYYRGYHWSKPPFGVEAWALDRPVDLLVGGYAASPPGSASGGLGWLELFRDHLPPWQDTLWGTVGGGIGETCTLALVLAGVFLVYRGGLRWRFVCVALGTVALLSAVLPTRTEDGLAWFPLLTAPGQFPAGVALMLFHLTGGGLLLGCLILAADPATTPLTDRGRLLFGVGVGALTMAARWFGLVPGSTYWAILAMSTLVPLIDRITKPRWRGQEPRCAQQRDPMPRHRAAKDGR